MHVELVTPKNGDPWDICLHYFFLHADGRPVDARKFLLACLDTCNTQIELAAMYCIIYEDALAASSADSAVARMIVHIFRRIGLYDIHSALERGETTARSPDINHLAEVVTNSIKLTRGMNIIFDFAEFSSVALNFIGTSCSVRDVIERIPKTFNIPTNNLLAIATDSSERSLIAELVRREGVIRVIPIVSTST
jgi:hypothetical protein